MQGGPGTISFHFDEVPPGEGNFNYAAYVRKIARLGRKVPLMLEHFAIEGYRCGLVILKNCFPIDVPPANPRPGGPRSGCTSNQPKGSP